MSRGMLVIVSGFSGAGKGTVLKHLMQKYSNYELSISMTTRQPRKKDNGSMEQDGVDYLFRSQDEFDALVAEEGFLEYARYVGKSYGTPKKFVVDNLEQGKIVIVEIEIQGAKQLKAIYPEAPTIFITPPSAEILYQRLVNRGSEDMDKVRQRMQTAQKESLGMDWYEHLIVNDDLYVAVEEMQTLITDCKEEKKPQLTSEKLQARRALEAQIRQQLQEINNK